MKLDLLALLLSATSVLAGEVLFGHADGKASPANPKTWFFHFGDDD